MTTRPQEFLRDLEENLTFEGYVPGTKLFEAEARARRVRVCQELKGFGNCDDCPALLSCTLASDHRRDVKYGVEEEHDEPKRRVVPD